MRIKDKAVALRKRFKLDSHHAIERFGVFFSLFAVTGLMVIAGAGAAAIRADSESLARTALYTLEFTTSKTGLGGEVDGVYVNEQGDKALVLMHFGSRASISYNAADYQGFLLGSDRSLSSETVSTTGIRGSLHVFGSTGYIGVLLVADEPFHRQVLNLTIRANAELSYDERRQADTAEEMAGDASFAKYDQWRIFFNPGASGTTRIPALESPAFDPAHAYYDIVLEEEEAVARGKLDQKLIAMRTSLAQIQAYTTDLETTKVDGLFLEAPAVPDSIAGDQVTGMTASEAEDGVATLALDTDRVVPGGFDVDWRAGNVYQGYLDGLVPPGQSYVSFLSDKRSEGSDRTGQEISQMQWMLSDGSNLRSDYASSDVTMRPLTNVMNNLSRAYQDFAKAKAEYQSRLLLDLLRLEVKLRDVQSNESVRADAEALATLY